MRLGWILWVAVGVVVGAVGALMLVVGLEKADQIGSVVGALCGVLGLGASGYGLVRARSTRPPASEPTVTNTISGTVSGSAVQAGTIDGGVMIGGGNATGGGNVVAGAGGMALGAGASVLLPQMAPPVEPLPPPKVDLCIGRDDQVAEVAAAWVAGKSVAVVGGPGIGKSTVLGRAVGDSAVVKSYGARRFVVACDGADSADAVVDKMATVLGVAPGDHLRNRVMSFVRSGPCVLVLDNFETPADNDPEGTARLAAEFRAEDSAVAMGIGYRGGSLPTGVTTAIEVTLGPLPEESMAEVFDVVSNSRHRTDPKLPLLLSGLDGVPLAIVLLATLARTEPHLDTLAGAWRAKHTDLLRYGSKPDRTSSLPVSIELSWDRLSSDARTALSLTALLPDGWPRGRADLYLPDKLAGVIELGGRALLHDDDSRQRCLAPIRQHLLVHHPPDPANLDGLVETIRPLVDRLGRVGRADGAEVTDGLAPEFSNLVEIIRTVLPYQPGLAVVVPKLLDFQRFSGLGDDQLGRDALAAAQEPTIRADNAFRLAQLYTKRNDNDKARELYGRAVSLFRSAGDVLGEANCLANLGVVAFRESDNDEARELFGRAVSLFRSVSDVLGEANCLRNLGRIAFRESDSEQARELLDEAVSLFRSVSDVLGEANCLRNLGEVALRESDHQQARELLDRAVPLYQIVGSVLGEANCLRNLGEVALRESDTDRARELFDGALLLYQKVRDRYSQAIAHAWQAQASSGERRRGHCGEMDRLAGELKIDGFREGLREIAGC